MKVADEQRGKTWHVDKSINIGYVLTSIVMAGSVFVWAAKMDTRVSVVESQLANTKDNEARTAILLRDNFSEMKASQIRIETKLDNKQDKVTK